MSQSEGICIAAYGRFFTGVGPNTGSKSIMVSVHITGSRFLLVIMASALVIFRHSFKVAQTGISNIWSMSTRLEIQTACFVRDADRLHKDCPA